MRGWLGRLIFKLNLPVIRQMLNGSKRVRIILTDRDHQQIVLVKNLLSRQKWSLPGGGVKKNESVIEAAQRELKEELGLAVPASDLKLLRQFDYVEDETKSNWRAVILSGTITKDSSLKIRRSELLKHAWHPIDNLPPNLSELTIKALAAAKTLA